MKNIKKRMIATVTIIVVASTILVACGSSSGAASNAEKVKDIPDVVTVCDHGNRIYQMRYGSNYGNVAVVSQDPTCAK
jgi:ABC-type Fe3+-citrate transport system substrate-binding protein